MNGLYPIIRRKRRPLVADVPPIPTKTEPVQSVAATPSVEPAESAPEIPSTQPEKSRDEDTNY
jgi:hypothetical protein